MTVPDTRVVMLSIDDYEAMLSKSRKWDVLEEILPEVTMLIRDLVELGMSEEGMPN
jgi:hypothetical protein